MCVRPKLQLSSINFFGACSGLLDQLAACQMPRKSLEDGKACDKEEACSMASCWDQHSSLRGLAKEGQRLVQDGDGKANVPASLENMSLNKLVLLELAKKMRARRRLSADPMDFIILMTLGWYELHEVLYKHCGTFDKQVWAFKDAWTVHKMFSKLRQKVMKDETPRELWTYRHVQYFGHYDFNCWCALHHETPMKMHVALFDLEAEDPAIQEIYFVLQQGFVARKQAWSFKAWILAAPQTVK